MGTSRESVSHHRVAPEAIMDHKKLRADLEKLHKEILRIDSVNPRERELLRSLDADLQKLLAQDVHSLQPDVETSQRVAQALARIEVAHPRIMLLTRQMIDSLSYLGV